MRKLLWFTLFAMTAVQGNAADIKVIANPSITETSMTADQLRGVFLMTKSIGGHTEIVLESSGAAHEFFLKEYLGKSDAALLTYYRSLVFTGKGSMPKILGSDAEVVGYVAKTKGAIGYISSGTSTAGVKVIEVK